MGFRRFCRGGQGLFVTCLPPLNSPERSGAAEGTQRQAGWAAWREKGAAIKCLKSLTKDAEERYEGVSCPPVRSQLKGVRKELKPLPSIFASLT